MRVTALPESLQTHLQRCLKIASLDSKSAALKPIYGYVQISTLGSMVTLRVHDPFVHFETRLLADTSTEDGDVEVECDRFYQVMKTRVEGQPVHLWTEGEFLFVKQGEFRAQIPTLKLEAFPKFEFSGKSDFEFDYEPSMLSATNRCGSVIEDDRGDAQFKGLLFDLTEEKTLRIAGFSQALLHVARFATQETGGFRASFAQKALPLLESLSSGLPMRLSFDKEGQRFVLTSSEFSLSVRCIEDTYPEGYVSFLGLHKMSDAVYPVTKLDKSGQIVEEIPRKFLKFRRQDFLASLGSAACVLSKEDNAIQLSVKQKLQSGQYLVELSGFNRLTKAKAQEKILSESNLDSSFSIGLHYGKVRECLKLFDADVFVMYVHTASDPVVLVEEGHKEFVSLSVPLRIS